MPEPLQKVASPQEFMDGLHEVGEDRIISSPATSQQPVVLLLDSQAARSARRSLLVPSQPKTPYLSTTAPSCIRPQPLGVQHDGLMAARVAEADEHGEVLRYVGSYDAESGVCQASMHGHGGSWLWR